MIANTDAWRKPITKANGEEACKCVVIHVDDILAVSPCTKESCEAIEGTHRLKEGTEEPKHCLGVEVKKTDPPNGAQCWAFEADHHVDNATKTTQKPFDEDRRNQKVIKKKTPLPSGCRPEIDMLEESSDEMASRHRQLIGML